LRNDEFIGNTTIKELNNSLYMIRTKEDIYTNTVVPYNYRKGIFIIDNDVPLDVYLVSIKVKDNSLILKTTRDVDGYVNYYTKKL